MRKVRLPVGATRKPEGLTRRELEVVELVREGRSNEDIAISLDISVNTVKSHMTHIFDKLGCFSRSELAYRAISPDLEEATQQRIDRLKCMEKERAAFRLERKQRRMQARLAGIQAELAAMEV